MKVNLLIGRAAAVLLAALVMMPAGAQEQSNPTEELRAAAYPTGEALGHTCAACHGTYGRLEGENFVPLAGMSSEEFIRAMKAFKSLERPSSIMSHIADGYSDEDIKRMAAFFADLSTGEEK